MLTYGVRGQLNNVSDLGNYAEATLTSLRDHWNAERPAHGVGQQNLHRR